MTLPDQGERVQRVGWSRRTEKPGYPFSYGYVRSRGHLRRPGAPLTLCGIDLTATEAQHFIEGERADDLDDCRRCAKANTAARDEERKP